MPSKAPQLRAGAGRTCSTAHLPPAGPATQPQRPPRWRQTRARRLQGRVQHAAAVASAHGSRHACSSTRQDGRMQQPEQWPHATSPMHTQPHSSHAATQLTCSHTAHKQPHSSHTATQHMHSHTAHAQPPGVSSGASYTRARPKLSSLTSRRGASLSAQLLIHTLPGPSPPCATPRAWQKLSAASSWPAMARSSA